MAADVLYSDKAEYYYAMVREDIIRLIPAGTKRLLDVGCGNGATSAEAKRRLGIREIVGVESFEPAAAVARERMDRVLSADIEHLALDFAPASFDCILCADVLEHTTNPWEVLKTLRPFLSDDGVLVASMPNVRHLGPVMKILLDRLEYEDVGILDRTHLRFFTLHTIRRMFELTAYDVLRVEANRSSGWPFRLLTILSLGLLRPFSVYQYLLVVRKRPL